MNSEKSFYLVVLSIFLFLTFISILRINLYPPELVLSQAVPMQPIMQQLVSSSVVSVNSNTFQAKAIDPVLQKLNLYSPASSNLLLGTAVQETMVGRLSRNIFQISLDTAKDVNNYYLAKNPVLKAAVARMYVAQKSLAWNLENNVAYEIAMARMIYLMKTDKPIPSATDPMALGKFWKVNYNTYLGKGTAKEYAVHFVEYEKDQQLAIPYSA